MMEINVYHIGLKILGRIYYTDFNEVIIKINVLPADDRIWEVVYIEAQKKDVDTLEHKDDSNIDLDKVNDLDNNIVDIVSSDYSQDVGN